MTRLRIAIVGYGTAGQAAAVLLSRDGHDVTVFERVATPGPVGAGFLLQPTGLQVLWQMELLGEVFRYGARVTRLYGDTGSGRTVMDMRYAGLDRRLCGIGLQRGALFAILASAWSERARRLRAGHDIVWLDTDRGLLKDANGERFGPYDLLLVADGSASTLRNAVTKPTLDRPYPWGALWCLLPAAEWPHVDELRQRYQAARKMVGLLPVGSCPDDATTRISLFWSLRSDAFERWQADGFDAFRSELRDLWPQAEALFSGLTSADQLARARYRDTILRHWHHGRAALIGDSAHAMSPQLGQGVNMALLDALVLRDALRGGGTVAESLQAYQSQRRRHVRIYQLWSRWLTPLFQSERDRLAGLRDLAFHPMGRLPGGRRQMLRVLSGTRQGLLGVLPLAGEFLDDLHAQVTNPGQAQTVSTS